jgi:hypothetical protein
MRCSGLFTRNESSGAHGEGPARCRIHRGSRFFQINLKQGAMTEIEIAAIELADRLVVDTAIERMAKVLARS